MNTSVYDMVSQVIGDTREKLASEAAAPTSVTKTASVQPQRAATPDGAMNDAYLNKLSAACHHLSDNLHLIDDNRTPTEKLAELMAYNEMIQKQGMEGGDKAHQTTQANADSISPKSVSTDSSGTSVGGSNAIPSSETAEPSPLFEAGQSGSATSGNQVPTSTAPSEKSTSFDAPTMMETNFGMMHPEQPEALLQQAGGAVSTGDKTASRAERVLNKLAGKDVADAHKAANLARNTQAMLIKAANSGIPQDVALAMMGIKVAEDAINPATLKAGKTPVLQSVPEANSAQSQGAEVGDMTPRATAPTTGEGGGRELISSVEAAINATKGQAKSQGKGALSQLLTEPMQSASHDTVLSQSLDNTSSAGVKISAARELLKRYMQSSPEAAQKLAALAKLSMDPDMMGPDAPAEAAAMPQEVAAMPPEAPGPSEEALAAVEAGVTPEELVEAMALQEEAAMADAAVAEGGMPEGGAEQMGAPPAGAEEPEKVQQMMGSQAGQAQGMGAASTPPPTPMMS